MGGLIFQMWTGQSTIKYQQMHVFTIFYPQHVFYVVQLGFLLPLMGSNINFHVWQAEFYVFLQDSDKKDEYLWLHEVDCDSVGGRNPANRLECQSTF